MFVVIFLSLICGHFSLPLEDDNSMFANVISNSIDEEDTIDLSRLGPEAFGSPKNDSGDAVATWSESSLVNPEELGSYAEGDILIPLRGKNGIRMESLQWPNGHIPYQVEGRFSPAQREIIMKAIADYHRLTCLRFVPYSGQQDYIVITGENTGCWSSVGRIDISHNGTYPSVQFDIRGDYPGWRMYPRYFRGGRQEVNLQIPGCVSKKGTVLHELLHAVGFFHEQSRPERDDFVTINYNNIKYGAENNFKKADPKEVDGYKVSYDYNSVMHYSEYAFSKNSQKTIEPRVSGAKLGQRDGLSRGDVRKVNNMYNCNKEEPESGWLNSVWQSLFGD